MEKEEIQTIFNEDTIELLLEDCIVENKTEIEEVVNNENENI